MKTFISVNLILVLSLALLLSLCQGCSDSQPICEIDTDCPDNAVCLNNRCVIINGDGGDLDGSDQQDGGDDAGPSDDAGEQDGGDPGEDSDVGPSDDAGAGDSCTLQTCIGLGYTCGDWDDGCEGILHCGNCDDGLTCQQGTCQAEPVDCSGIQANPAFELCDSGPDHCAGVFTNGAGCIAYCAAAGLVCTARFGGEPNCQKETITIPCGENNGHMSDWCECGRGQVNPDCNIDPGNPPVQREKHYNQAVFDPRSSWVLQCRDYAYTAQYAEHEACDNLYVAGSGRGTATFTFDAPRGMYDVYIEGRHTINRNPSGALVIVTSNGQSHSVYIMQRDEGNLVWDYHGQYCLDGGVQVVMDSSVSSASDSVRRVRLTPAN
ncbi:MAG: hypothetical protein JRJ87_09700 [Deltaproteobacteria bacterium]|nr:hypothetical protein [Deltaproteobacteria bacterium]